MNGIQALRSTAFIGLGSNLGDRAGILARALRMLEEAPGISVTGVSSVYETEPWGNPDQPAFLNQAAEIRTDLAPAELLAACQDIERRLGRTSGPRWGPRALDVDILLYGSRVLDSENLRIPHPRLADRRFVLVPLAEIAAGTVVPPAGGTVSELLDACEDAGAVRRIGPDA